MTLFESTNTSVTFVEKPDSGAVSSGESTDDARISLPQLEEELSSRRSTWEYLIAPVRASIFVEVQLVILTFCTGLQDAISFPDFHCFVSNQTGNTVLLMVAAVAPDLNGQLFVTANVAAAMGIFLGGAYVTGQLGHLIGPRRRLWLIICNLVQTLLVFGAAALQYTRGVHSEGPLALGAIALLAAAAGSQVVQPRSLAMQEISTAMATAGWLDLVIDPDLFQLKNRSRNRRVAFLATLLLGSLVGAVTWRQKGSAVAILVSGVGKLLVTLMYFFAPLEPQVSLSRQVKV